MKKLIVLFVSLLVSTGHIKAALTHEVSEFGEMVDSLIRQEMSDNGCHRAIAYGERESACQCRRHVRRLTLDG